MKSVLNAFKDVRAVYKTRSAIIFLVLILLYGLGYGFYRGIQDNYLAQILHVTEFQRGLIEFLRETPGLLLIFILALFHKFNEKSILKISFLVCAIGILGLALLPADKIPVVLFMVIFSVGEHMIMPYRSSIAMHNAEKGNEGLALGIVTSFDNVGRILGYAFVALLFFIFSFFNLQEITEFKSVFFASSVVFVIALIIAIICLKNKGEKVERVESQRLYFRKKFTMFYILELFYGARKQIFLTFGPYVLILIYGASTEVIATLYVVCSVTGILFMPLIGKIIDKMGYKFVMVFDTVLLIFVCLIYGFANKIFPTHIAYYVVMFNFVLDAIISQASIASSVYVKELSDNENEITATLTTGISVNHIMSILIALLGGTIWLVAGVELLFIFAAIFSLGNTIFASFIKDVRAKE